MHGISVIPLKQVHDKRGKIMRMLRCDESHFRQFGEIYFSVVYPGAVKAWHLHSEKMVNLAVIEGLMKVVLYDERSESPTAGKIEEIIIGPENYCLVIIPPGIWYGFQALGTEKAILADCATHICPPEEDHRKQSDDPSIPYKW
ncbi:MAG: dTDP-4-dehydrorhamnose 3,5-epimerase family protein [Candidatus Eremiobacteraeota bacterium]|nr:dTDP-4-dehydrorhamnose 3,5-epimerase family protein [Candidatus Eremiobacteraeota bacterium]